MAHIMRIDEMSNTQQNDNKLVDSIFKLADNSDAALKLHSHLIFICGESVSHLPNDIKDEFMHDLQSDVDANTIMERLSRNETVICQYNEVLFDNTKFLSYVKNAFDKYGKNQTDGYLIMSFNLCVSPEEVFDTIVSNYDRHGYALLHRAYLA